MKPETYVINQENSGGNCFCATATCSHIVRLKPPGNTGFCVKKSDVTMAELGSHIPGTVNTQLLPDHTKAFHLCLRFTHTENSIQMS